MTNAMTRGLAVAAAWLALLPQAAVATPITYDFAVAATSGPLAGATATGSFTFDSSSIPASLPGSNSATGLLTALTFTWDGIAYGPATANTGWLTFDAAGELATAGFGTNCGAGFCVVTVGPADQWYAVGTMFAYAFPGAPGLGFGTVEMRPRAAVPEPASVALLALALAAMAASRRRARA